MDCNAMLEGEAADVWPQYLPNPIGKLAVIYSRSLQFERTADRNDKPLAFS